MRITFINQTFYPDVVSTAQHLKDLALYLAQLGHEVTVVSSRRAYDHPGKLFPREETWQGIKIIRVSNTGFGKRSKLCRIIDFGTFIASCCWRLCRLPRQDLVVALTSPPIISFIGALFTHLKGGQFCYWVMDLNPDEAIAAGWLKPGSIISNILERCSRFSLATAAKIVVLDEFMRDRVLIKGIPAENIEVIPPWSHDSEVRFDATGRTDFRKQHGLEDKFVIMYAGNHSPCHPLDTIMHAASKLARHSGIAFCFIGGGSEFSRVKNYARDNGLKNIVCLPYEPIERLSASLSAADLHVVVMGNPFVGIIHPCKIYNILRIGMPLLYVGPQQGHIPRILNEANGEFLWAAANHGEIESVCSHILRLKDGDHELYRGRNSPYTERFSSNRILPALAKAIESMVGANSLRNTN